MGTLCRSASELRASMDRALRAKASLSAAVKALMKSNKQEDAEAVQAAIEVSKPDANLLEGDLQSAEDALCRWRALTACEMKLARAMKDGNSSATLARVLQVVSCHLAPEVMFKLLTILSLANRV